MTTLRERLIQLARTRKSPALATYLDDAKPIGDAKTTPFQGVDSSWIMGLRWTPEYGAEMSTKKGKHTYAYQGINKEIFRRWLASKSKGKAWWRYVGYPMRGVYGPTKLSQTDFDALVRASNENPQDQAPRLILADWLDENGRSEEAVALRYYVQHNFATRSRKELGLSGGYGGYGGLKTHDRMFNYRVHKSVQKLLGNTGRAPTQPHVSAHAVYVRPNYLTNYITEYHPTKARAGWVYQPVRHLIIGRDPVPAPEHVRDSVELQGKPVPQHVVDHIEGRTTPPVQLSRWTGPTHPIFADPGVDGPVDLGKFVPGRHELLAWLKSQISPQATPQHLAALTGWLPGTTLNYYWQNKTGNIAKTLATEVSDPHGLYSAHRTIHASGNNDPPHIENDLISIPRDPHNPYRGTSGSLLLRQMRAAYEMGIPSINWFSAYDEPGEAAARRAPTTNLLQQFFPALAALPQHNDDEFTGGLTWPLMGADGILPPRYIKSVPREIVDEAQHMSQGRFINNQKISDFFASPTARDYYIAHPTAHDGFVDTTPGSYSRKAIEYHVSKNAVQRGMAPAIPDAQMPKKPLHLQRRRYAPHIEHLLATGELHPEFFDEYFTVR